jgi:hypothetical protein
LAIHTVPLATAKPTIVTTEPTSSQIHGRRRRRFGGPGVHDGAGGAGVVQGADGGGGGG